MRLIRALRQKSNLAKLAAIVVVFVWIAVAGAGGPFFGKISDVVTNDQSTFLPSDAESTRVSSVSKQFYDSSTIPLIVVFESRNGDIDADKRQIVDDTLASIGSEALVRELSTTVPSEDGDALLAVLPLSSQEDYASASNEIRSELEAAITSDSGLTFALTGPALLSSEFEDAFSGIDGVLLAAALATVFIILVLVYRSPILPFVTLSAAVIALCAAIVVVYYLAKADVVTINGQVQGILFILVIGAATDYALLYVARFKEELLRSKTSWQATKKTWRASVEPISAAGGTVILGLLCLLVSMLASNQALGPVGAIGIAFSIVVALTYLPAMLLLLGRFAFWPTKPVYSAKPPRKQHAFWEKVAAFVVRYPRRVWVGVSVTLVVACLGVIQLNANGVPQDELILGDSEARRGQAILEKHFSEGAGSPVRIYVNENDRNEAILLLDSIEGIEGVSLVSSDGSSKPIGKQRAEIISAAEQKIDRDREQSLQELRSSITQIVRERMGESVASDQIIESSYRQAAQQIPSTQSIVEETGLLRSVEAKVVDDHVMLEATIAQNPNSQDAQQLVADIREELAQKDIVADVGGVTATQLDTLSASTRDLLVIIPLILGLITVVLMALLRAIVAPLILVVTTVLSFGATLGVAALLFNNVWEFVGADPWVVIFGFVFLVALGIDYNIFLMTRVREEVQLHGTRKGVVRALVVTGGVITSAGIVLAATFAALGVIPIMFLAQIAFIVAFGVIIDTLIVRSLLVPALTLEIDRLMWWPSKLWRTDKSTKGRGK